MEAALAWQGSVDRKIQVRKTRVKIDLWRKEYHIYMRWVAKCWRRRRRWYVIATLLTSPLSRYLVMEIDIDRITDPDQNVPWKLNSADDLRERRKRFAPAKASNKQNLAIIVLILRKCIGKGNHNCLSSCLGLPWRSVVSCPTSGSLRFKRPDWPLI